MKYLQLAAALLGGALIGLSSNAAAETVIVKLKSYEEVPSVSSVATGHFKAFIDERAGAINYELSYGGLSGQRASRRISTSARHIPTAGYRSIYARPPPRRTRRGLHRPVRSRERSLGKIRGGECDWPSWARASRQSELAELIAAIRAGRRVRQRALGHVPRRRGSRPAPVAHHISTITAPWHARAPLLRCPLAGAYDPLLAARHEVKMKGMRMRLVCAMLCALAVPALAQAPRSPTPPPSTGPSMSSKSRAASTIRGDSPSCRTAACSSPNARDNCSSSSATARRGVR